MATKFVGEPLSSVKWAPLSNSVLDQASICATGYIYIEIFPKQLFFLGDESMVLSDLLRILFDGYVDVFFDEIPVECFKVEIYLPHIFFREIVKSTHDVLLNL